jgi:hypothetical protein
MEYTECSHAKCGNPVFSTGLCRKHYEGERLATAAPCSFFGCAEKSYRGNLCAKHYREKIKENHPKCTVPGCSDPQKHLTLGFCQKHLFRFTRHGTIEQPRPDDWGAKEVHPLYQTHHWHRRKVNGMCQEWKDNFWEFVNTVGSRPPDSTLRKPDPSAPLGPLNWVWKEKIPSVDKSAYQRLWRAKNPDRAKGHDLKKMYGITLDQYVAMEIAQNNVCAICNQRETACDKKGIPRKMPVDHCHQTGKIRALLCTACNRALGLFKDNPSVLRNAANYIEKHLDTPQK